MSLELRPAGARTVLVELEAEASPGAAAAAARAAWTEIEEAVPGHRTVLLRWRGAAPDEAEIARVLAAAPARSDAGATAEVRIPVRYVGPDLEVVAAGLGIGVDELVARHVAAELQVGFLGMAGFPYLLGGDPVLRVPRRAEPRVRVPAGAVAIAAGYTGIYTRATPGGWSLLGTTDVELFDPQRAEPALLAPGMRVRLEAVR